MNKAFKQRTCKDCGWVHFGVSWKYALEEVNRFNTYFAGLTRKEQLENYGGKPSNLLGYMLCNFCGSDYTRMRAYKKGDMPNGCTVGPIIYVRGSK